MIAWQIQRGRDAGWVLTLVHPGKRIERSVHDTMKEARETLQAAIAFYGPAVLP